MSKLIHPLQALNKIIDLCEDRLRSGAEKYMYDTLKEILRIAKSAQTD